MTFSERLRELRSQAGLTQQALADRCEIPLGTLRNYEQGIREPAWDVLFKIARALDVSCEEFAVCAGLEPRTLATVDASSPAPVIVPKAEKIVDWQTPIWQELTRN